MKTKCLAVLAGQLLVLSAVANEIDWGTGANRIYDFDGVTALSTNVGIKTSNTACLVQLVYAGINGLADTANLTSTGSMSDDVVVAWTYIGASQPASQATAAGRFTRFNPLGYNNSSYPNDSKFFIRAWDLPSPDFPSGAVPAGAYYGNSQMFIVSNNVTAGPDDQFTMTTSFSTTLLPIPEPAAALAILTGVGLLIIRHRYKMHYR